MIHLKCKGQGYLKLINEFNEEITTNNDPTSNDIIKNASTLIKNFFPQNFNDTINLFYLNNYMQWKNIILILKE